MPFASEKQRRYLWMKKPEVARKFAEHAKLVIPKHLVGKVNVRLVGGATGPGIKPPEMPDFESLFAQPESKARADQEAKGAAARRRSNWRDLNFSGIHGETPDAPILRYVEGETSTADAAVKNLKHYLSADQIRQHHERIATLDYEDVNGSTTKRKTKKG